MVTEQRARVGAEVTRTRRDKLRRTGKVHLYAAGDRNQNQEIKEGMC